MIREYRIEDLQEHPLQKRFFRPIEGREYETFLADINQRGIIQPIVVSVRTGSPVICDGHQRTRAAEAAGHETIRAEVFEFEDEAEEVRMLVMNNTQRRQLSREEMERVITYWLVRYAERSNNWIASDLGVSKNTVEEKRRELESTCQIDKLDKLQGRDGKERPRTQKPRKAPEEAVADDSGGEPGNGANSEAGSEYGPVPDLPEQPGTSGDGFTSSPAVLPDAHGGDYAPEPEDAPRFVQAEPTRIEPDKPMYSNAHKRLRAAVEAIMELSVADAALALDEDALEPFPLRKSLGSAYSKIGRMLSESKQREAAPKPEAAERTLN